MKLQPLVFTGSPARAALPELPSDCCGRCKFWFLEGAQSRGKEYPIAPCRRYPGSVVVLSVPMDSEQLDKLRLHPQLGLAIQAGQVPSQQQPVPAQVVKSADDWCGEFSARPIPEKK